MSLKQRLLDQESGADQDESLNLVVRDAELQLESDKNATERTIIERKKALALAKVTLPYSPSKIIKAQEELESAEAGMAALIRLRDQDFPA